VLIVLATVVGLAIGSFLNVVVHRVPAGQSLSSPPSRCPRCEHPVRPYDNVPVLSWFWLRGRCRDCHEPISVRYPLVEAGTAVAFGLVAAAVGWSWQLPVMEYLVAVAIALGLIDLDVHRLPDRIVLPSYAVVAALLVVAAVGDGLGWWPLVRAAIGAAVLGGTYLVLAVVRPGGMGMGDVKLAALLGMLLGFVGWGALAVGGFAAFLLGGVFGLALVATRRGGRGTGIPFGPWMLLGAAVGVVSGERLWAAYTSLL
jgi:leader peptidase (prepilin peptidase) / N-methyltransferase